MQYGFTLSKYAGRQARMRVNICSRTFRSSPSQHMASHTAPLPPYHPCLTNASWRTLHDSLHLPSRGEGMGGKGGISAGPLPLFMPRRSSWILLSFIPSLMVLAPVLGLPTAWSAYTHYWVYKRTIPATRLLDEPAICHTTSKGEQCYCKHELSVISFERTCRFCQAIRRC